MGTMFPGPGAIIYRNGAGEVTGWDEEGSFEPEYHPCCGVTGRCVCDDADDDEGEDDSDNHWHHWVCEDGDDLLTNLTRDDLDRLYEQRRHNGERGPYCMKCYTDYDTVIHGDQLED